MDSQNPELEQMQQQKIEEPMADSKENSHWRSGLRKPKTPTLSEMIQSRRDEGRPYLAGELRAILVEREMARHNFSEEQALAEILAFSRPVQCPHTVEPDHSRNE